LGDGHRPRHGLMRDDGSSLAECQGVESFEGFQGRLLQAVEAPRLLDGSQAVDGFKDDVMPFRGDELLREYARKHDASDGSFLWGNWTAQHTTTDTFNMEETPGAAGSTDGVRLEIHD